jgi:hypothetical protein
MLLREGTAPSRRQRNKEDAIPAVNDKGDYRVAAE